ncbi:MAG: glycosyltransferase [Elusimicrobiota bacterium]|nr:glycosyltransferase [Endomicrobiia bacterium]MDW8165359.1 glycosyltransferase [Elusimicrobiota bacterium]
MQYSIIIITKDNKNKVENLVKLLLEEIKRDDFEIIVIEANKEYSCLPSLNNIKHIKISYKEAGFSHQRNLGVLHSASKFVIFIDDDVEIEKDWFEKITSNLCDDVFGAMGAVFPKKENANFISFCIGVLGHPGGGFRLHFYSKGKIIKLSQVATCNTIFRKDVILEVGMFNLENRYGSEDSDLCLRIIKRYGEKKFLYIPDALVWHDTHKNLLKMIKWYIRRGMADIDLVATSKLHWRYIIQTALSFKLFFAYLVSLFFKPFFLLFLFLWYITQLIKYFFMWKYFDIYKFGFLYRIFTFFCFPIIKFIADISFDIGRIIRLIKKYIS